MRKLRPKKDRVEWENQVGGEKKSKGGGWGGSENGESK